MNPTQKKFHAEQIDWDRSERNELEAKAVGWKRFGIAGWVFVAFLIVAIVPLLALHEFIPVVVTVDKVTGTYTVRTGGQAFDMDDPRSERTMIADLGRYVKAREGFTMGEAQNNYSLVYYMSSDAIRGLWDAEYKPDLNPNALMNRLTPTDSHEIASLAVSFLPSDSPKKYRVAQVRFDKIKREGSKGPTIQRFVSTLTYAYDEKNIPKTVEGLTYNPFGFTVLNYRRDKETEERELLVQQEAPDGVFQQGAGAR